MGNDLNNLQACCESLHVSRLTWLMSVKVMTGSIRFKDQIQCITDELVHQTQFD